jgi:hypothetical protein
MTAINRKLNTKIANAIQHLHPDWFSKATTEFWGSEVYWQTLTQTKDGWHFITSEDTAPRTSTRYTIRKAYGEKLDYVGEFQQYATLGEAIKALAELEAIQKAWSERHLRRT